jgi:hypothetical protein
MLWLDLETISAPEAGDFIEDGKPPANYKDKDKIASWLAADRAKRLEKAALDIDLCEIIAAAVIRSDGTEQTYIVGGDVSEPELVSALYAEIDLELERARLVTDNAGMGGFNLLNFDLCVLARRAAYLSVAPTRLDLGRYTRDPILDVMVTLSGRDPSRTHTLGFYCRRAGVPHDDSVSGAAVASLVADGHLDAVAGHALDDCRSTQALASRMGLSLAWNRRGGR